MISNIMRNTGEEFSIDDIGAYAYIVSLLQAGASITLATLASTTRISKFKFKGHAEALQTKGLLKYTTEMTASQKGRDLEYTFELTGDIPAINALDAKMVQLYMPLVGADGIGLYAFMQENATEGIYYSEGVRKDAEKLGMSTSTFQKITRTLITYGMIEKDLYKNEANSRLQICFRLPVFKEFPTRNILQLPPLSRDLYLRAIGAVTEDDISVTDFTKGIYQPTLRNFYYRYKSPRLEVISDFPERVEENAVIIMVDGAFRTVSRLVLGGGIILGNSEELKSLARLEEANSTGANYGALSAFMDISRKLAARRTTDDVSNLPYLLLDEGEEAQTQAHILIRGVWKTHFNMLVDKFGWDKTNLNVE